MCDYCKHYMGRMSTAKKSVCLKCGSAIDENTKVIDTVSNGSDLQRLVSSHNMPKEFRDEFEKISKIATQKSQVFEVDKPTNLDLAMLMNLVSESLDESGYITSESLSKALIDGKFSNTAESILEMAEYDGYLLRAGDNKWKIID